MYVKFCERCGTSLNEFYQTGMLGCPHCYEIFRNEIKSVLTEVQGSVRHVGKAPKIDGINKELIAEYNRLIAEKDRAGIEGRFSDMARLAKDVLDLRGELERRGLI